VKEEEESLALGAYKSFWEKIMGKVVLTMVMVATLTIE
jgi:hypothetical protein